MLSNEYTASPYAGVMVSDAGALEDMMYNHHYFHDPEDAAVLALQQGVNLYLGPMPPLTIYSFLRQAYDHSRISRALLETRARDLFRLRLRLGEFDPPQLVPFNYCALR